MTGFVKGLYREHQVSLMVKAAIADRNISDCHRMSWGVPGQVQAGLGLGIRVQVVATMTSYVNSGHP